MNFVEVLPNLLVILMIGGYFFPLVTLCIGCITILGKTIYTIMYLKWGGNQRKLGAVMYGVSTYGLCFAIIGKIGFNIINWNPNQFISEIM